MYGVQQSNVGADESHQSTLARGSRAEVSPQWGAGAHGRAAKSSSFHETFLSNGDNLEGGNSSYELLCYSIAHASIVLKIPMLEIIIEIGGVLLWKCLRRRCSMR